jgi:hypothetical protein
LLLEHSIYLILEELKSIIYDAQLKLSRFFRPPM